MASLIQNYVQGKLIDVASGVATYAITTGGKYVGDTIISAGDLIEGAGRNVGGGVEGYIDRYGNWIRSYGNAAITATAAGGSGPTPAGMKALPAPKQMKALPAPAVRPGLRKSASDAGTRTKALPAAGVRKALPPPEGKAREGLSKGQLAQLRGVRAEDLKKKDKKQGPPSSAGSVRKPAGPTPVVSGAAPRARKDGADKDKKDNKQQQKSPYTASVVGKGPTGAGAKAPDYPRPTSTKRPDGKVVVSKESKPSALRAAKTAGAVSAAKKNVKKDDKGRVDFMKLMGEDAKKKGSGSVAGSVRSNAAAKKAPVSGGGGGVGGGKSGYDFF